MPIRYLTLQLTTRCNLKCRYCYQEEHASETDMPLAVIQHAFSLTAAEEPGFHLQLTGGEPTLVPESIQAVAESAGANDHCRSMGIQTNGTRLTPELVKLFKSFGFQVGISLDGPPSVHEGQRGMTAETLRGLRLLESHQVPFRVTTVITGFNARHLDRLVLTLAGFSCARGIGLDLLVKKGTGGNPLAVTPAEPAALTNGLRKMITVLNAVNTRRKVPIRLREYEMLHSSVKKKRSVFCHACREESLAVRPDGKLFPCAQTSGDPYFTAGTVWSPEFDKLKTLRIFRPENKLCNTCDLASFCPGDCPSRLHYNRIKDQSLVCYLYRILWQIRTGEI